MLPTIIFYLTIILVLCLPFSGQPMGLWHVIPSLGAYILLGVAGLQALVLLAQLYTLKRNPDAAWLDRLPPVEEMQKLMLVSLFFGCGLLTVGIIGGLAELNSLTLLIAKGSLTLIAWLIYVALLITHYQKGLIPRTTALWVIMGWLFLTFAYFGTKLMSGSSP